MDEEEKKEEKEEEDNNNLDWLESGKTKWKDEQKKSWKFRIEEWRWGWTMEKEMKKTSDTKLTSTH